MAQLQSAEDGVESVATDIAQRAGAEVPPATPGEREIGGIIGAIGRGAEPEVPVQALGHRWSGGRAVDALRPEHAIDAVQRPVRPDMNLPHLSDRAGPDCFAEDPHLFTGLALVPHLRGNLVFAAAWAMSLASYTVWLRGFSQ